MAGDASLRLVTWNLGWAPLPGGRSPRGRQVQRLISDQQPDLACLTEARGGWFAQDGGEVVASEPLPEQRHMHRHDGRKVLLWSATGWTDVDVVGADGIRDLARFVAATTSTRIGPLRVIGVVIPYRGSNVSHGLRDRRVWDDHRRYISALRTIVDRSDLPTVLVGDFNQRHPFDPGYGVPKDLHDGLIEALGRLRIVTGGHTVPGIGHPLIDHVAVSPEFDAQDLAGWSAVQDDVELSDHPGFRIHLRAANGTQRA